MPQALAHDLQAMARAQAYNDWLIDRARPWLRGRVLDVGAGIGTHTTQLRGLADAGFDPYVGHQVPVNDGGISYGQAAVAAARLAGR